MKLLLNSITYINGNSETIKNIIEITQGIVIIVVTIFTARWTYKTFAHKEKIAELKELKRMIELLHWKMEIFCAQVREKELSKEEINEKAELMSMHIKIFSLSSLNLYTKPEIKEEILNIVGKWVSNEKIGKMQYKKDITEEQEKIRKNEWDNFNIEYKKVQKIIDREAGKII